MQVLLAMNKYQCTKLHHGSYITLLNLQHILRSISGLVTVNTLKWFSGIRIILLIVVRIWAWVGGSWQIRTLVGFLKYVHKNGRSL